MESWQQLPCPDSQLQQENKFRLNFNASVPSGTTSRKRKCPLSRHHQHARTDKPTQIKKRKKKTRSLEEIFFYFFVFCFSFLSPVKWEKIGERYKWRKLVAATARRFSVSRVWLPRRNLFDSIHFRECLSFSAIN